MNKIKHPVQMVSVLPFQALMESAGGSAEV